jgi:hypothetical protein
MHARSDCSSALRLNAREGGTKHEARRTAAVQAACDSSASSSLSPPSVPHYVCPASISHSLTNNTHTLTCAFDLAPSRSSLLRCSAARLTASRCISRTRLSPLVSPLLARRHRTTNATRSTRSLPFSLSPVRVSPAHRAPLSQQLHCSEPSRHCAPARCAPTASHCQRLCSALASLPPSWRSLLRLRLRRRPRRSR